MSVDPLQMNLIYLEDFVLCLRKNDELWRARIVHISINSISGNRTYLVCFPHCAASEIEEVGEWRLFFDFIRVPWGPLQSGDIWQKVQNLPFCGTCELHFLNQSKLDEHICQPGHYPCALDNCDRVFNQPMKRMRHVMDNHSSFERLKEIERIELQMLEIIHLFQQIFDDI